MQSIQVCFDRSATRSLAGARLSRSAEDVLCKAIGAHKWQGGNPRGWKKPTVHQCVTPLASSAARDENFSPPLRQSKPFGLKSQSSGSFQRQKNLRSITSNRRMVPKASLDADLSEQVSGHRKEGSITKVALGLAVLVTAGTTKFKGVTE